MYFHNYYQKTVEKGRIHYDLYFLQNIEKVPEDYEELDFVCLRQDGSYEATTTLSNICRLIQNRIEGLENFHFHQLRHTFHKRGTLTPPAFKPVCSRGNVSFLWDIWALCAAAWVNVAEAYPCMEYSGPGTAAVRFCTNAG